MGSELHIKVGEPELLGEPVRCRLGQATAIGVNPLGQKELYFVANGHPATFYVLDLIHGTVQFSYDIPESDAVWAMTVAADGDVYFSCTSGGILYRYSQVNRDLQSVAMSADDGFVWDLQAGPGDTIVSATYPRSKIFEYRIGTSEYIDRGRVSEEEQYARGIAVTADHIYVGIGSTIRLIRLDRHTGAKEELSLAGYSGEKGFIDRIWMLNGLLFLSIDQHEIIVYHEAQRKIITRFSSMGAISPAMPERTGHYFVAESQLWKYDRLSNQVSWIRDMPECSRTARIKLMQWTAFSNTEWRRILENVSAMPEKYHDPGDDRSMLVIVSCYADIWYYDPQTNDMFHSIPDVPLKPLLIQSMQFDDSGMMYIGGYHRGLCFYNVEKQSEELQIPNFPQIEGIGFLNQKVYFGTYTKAIVYEYDRTKPLQVKPDDRLPEANPRMVFPIRHRQDRPFVFTSGDDQLFIGTIPDYGLNTGVLTVYDDRNDKWTVYPDIAPNLSISGLAYLEGMLYGGTSIWGGLGREPVEDVAQMFIWDTVKQQLVRRFIPDIPGLDMPPKMIGELSVGPDGQIWGAVDGTIFVMEPVSGRIIRSRQVSLSRYAGKFRPIYLRWGQDGLLYTALGRKLVIIDPGTLAYDIVDHEPLSIMTVGRDGHIYYSRGSRLYRRIVTRSIF